MLIFIVFLLWIFGNASTHACNPPKKHYNWFILSVQSLHWSMMYFILLSRLDLPTTQTSAWFWVAPNNLQPRLGMSYAVACLPLPSLPAILRSDPSATRGPSFSSRSATYIQPTSRSDLTSGSPSVVVATYLGCSLMRDRQLWWWIHGPAFSCWFMFFFPWPSAPPPRV